MKPYTYYLFCRPTQQHYYGSRYAKNCSPDDLWVRYYTSSKKVKRLLAEHGPDAFDVQVRRIFETREQAIQWESRVLTKLDAANRSDWINQHNGKGRVRSGFAGRTHTASTKQKQAAAKQGRKRPDVSLRNRTNNPAKGRVISEDHRRKISEALKGIKRPYVAERNRLRSRNRS